MSRRRGSPPHPLFGEEARQLGLFDASLEASVDPREDTRRELEVIADRLPRKLRFGTSSWTFPGWAGLVYHRRYANQRAFLRDSLREYAGHPLMRTVGIDRSYYAPIPEADLALYTSQLPDDFKCAMKVWQRIAMPVYPRHPRYGAEAGKQNPDFLNPNVFIEAIHQPVQAGFGRCMGPWILEIAPSPSPIDPVWFCRKLGEFFRQVPRDFPFAVELRDRRLLSSAYVQTLREHEASHVFNYWSRMPSLTDQMRVPGLLNGDLLVVRLMLPPGALYGDLKEAYAPFDKLVEVQPAMREDVIRLVQVALQREMDAYVLVNNKAEGSSPLTVQALAEQIAG